MKTHNSELGHPQKLEVMHIDKLHLVIPTYKDLLKTFGEKK